MTELPSTRQERIMFWLRDHQTLTIDDLAGRLAVSAMTIHRDLNELARIGAVEKVHGGVRLTRQTVLGAPVVTCAVCGGGVPERSSFLISAPDGTMQTACCPHCGFLAPGLDAAAAVLAREYLYGRMVNARQALYVVDSAVTLCCQPSALCFATAADAERFQRGFGGTVMGFDAARAATASTHGTCSGHGQHP